MGSKATVCISLLLAFYSLSTTALVKTSGDKTAAPMEGAERVVIKGAGVVVVEGSEVVVVEVEDSEVVHVVISLVDESTPCPPPSHERTDIPTVMQASTIESKIRYEIPSAIIIYTHYAIGVVMGLIIALEFKAIHFSPLQGLSFTITLAGAYYFGVCTTPFWVSLDPLSDYRKQVRKAGSVLFLLCILVLGRGPFPSDPSPFPRTLTTLAIGLVLQGASLAAIFSTVETSITPGIPISMITSLTVFIALKLIFFLLRIY